MPMSLWRLLFRKKEPTPIFDPTPELTETAVTRPYVVLHANIPFYEDSECRKEVTGARLVILRCDDSRQRHVTVETMPSRKNYTQGQRVTWDLNNKKIWNDCWFRNPESGKVEKAWAQAVEFAGKVIVSKDGHRSTTEARAS
jgi:hypothetical protein